jgi:hypothetical protein
MDLVMVMLLMEVSDIVTRSVAFLRRIVFEYHLFTLTFFPLIFGIF